LIQSVPYQVVGILLEIQGHISETESLTDPRRSSEKDGKVDIRSIYPGEDAFANLDQEKWQVLAFFDRLVETVGKQRARRVIEPSPGFET
jgi:hypothetical protein